MYETSVNPYTSTALPISNLLVHYGIRRNYALFFYCSFFTRISNLKSPSTLWYPSKLCFVFYCSFFTKLSNLKSPIPSIIPNGTSAKVSPSFFSLHCYLCFVMTPFWYQAILSIYSTFRINE